MYICLGLFFVALGSLGVLLPVLPTTPFLLLASFFFTRCSDRFNRWFVSTKLYQNHLEDFMRERSMKLGTKIKLVIFASSVMLISAITVEILSFKIFMGFMLAYLYYYFIFRIKTIHV
ncbi:MAG: DUF454 domain-containing protein [Firmicutes bacterium]|nr:DUF454 domain-containing protein [Bacillota bacterium]